MHSRGAWENVRGKDWEVAQLDEKNKCRTSVKLQSNVSQTQQSHFSHASRTLASLTWDVNGWPIRVPAALQSRHQRLALCKYHEQQQDTAA